MKKLFLAASTGLMLALAACSNSNTETDNTDSNQQEGSIPAGDQSGTVDRMNNTSDSMGASSSQQQASGTTPGGDNPGSNDIKGQPYQPETNMDTAKRNR
jgi:hypothetical protein